VRTPLLWAAAALVAAGACSPAYGDNRQVVLLELFTSQGCSSCPPADELLAELGREEGLVALSFHVDYWNDLGWRDPFSSEAWTARQQRYARALGEGRVYTPQLVVQGREHVVGSDRRGAAAAIRRARADAPSVALAVRARLDRKTDRVRVTASARGGGHPELWAALVESGLETRVPRGENSGRALADGFVVRRLERVTDGQADLAVARGWRRDRLAVVVFAQDPSDLRVLSAVRSSIE
jgi:hypothetical protein